MSSHTSPKPKGILRNAPPAEAYQERVLEHYDRKKVYENTLKNAQLRSPEHDKAIKSSTGTELSNATPPNGQTSVNPGDSEEHMKWDEANIYLTEQERTATMKIDEPKTPYTGGVDPNNEYYRDDDELDDPGFSLGEPEFAPAPVPKDEVERLIVDEKMKDNGGNEEEEEGEGEEEGEEGEEEEEEEEELTPEEKHRRFEEMRKQHYHMKGAVLHQQFPDEEDE